MKTLFKRHRVRATFYHIVAALYLISSALTESGVIGFKLGFWIGVALFFADYIAEMYDPNPENPGPWFKSHFHRMFDDCDEEEGEVEK
jgi:hypothetical protein